MLKRILLLLPLLALHAMSADAARDSARPNIVLYVIDTLRADHVSALGYGRETTPHIDRWSKQGALFTHAWSTSPWTKPSMVSVFTSLHVPTHRAAQHGQGIPDTVATLVTLLEDAGYNTYGATDNPFTGKDSNLHRGYDLFMERTRVQDEYPGMASSAAINTIAFEWLKRKTRPPFFLYLHTMDPHMPYEPPPPHHRQWADPAEDAEFKQWYGALARVRPFGGGMLARPQDCLSLGIPQDVLTRRMIDRYDGEIAHNDARFNELMVHLKEKGLLDNTIVAILSDHGEAFFEHGWTAHGATVHEEQTRSLFALIAPGRVPEGLRIDSPVSLIDLLPTILGLCELTVPGNVQGRDLAPLIAGEESDREAVYSVKTPFGDHTLDMPELENLSVARIEAEWKTILTLGGPDGEDRIELYNRAGDPRDATNAAARHPDVAEEQASRIREWLRKQEAAAETIAAPGRRKPDKALTEQMRKLGYVR